MWRWRSGDREEPQDSGVASRPAEFSFDKAVVELVGDDCFRDGHQFRFRSVVWITVTNDCAEAEFSARFSLRINTARREYPTVALEDDYTDDVAWENTKTRKNSIGHKGDARLMPIWSFIEAPGLFWFDLPQKDLYGSGYARGWVLRPLEDHVDFDLRVTNESTGESIENTARLTFDEHGRAVSLDWVDLSSEPKPVPIPVPVSERAREFVGRSASMHQLRELRPEVHLLEAKLPTHPFGLPVAGFEDDLDDWVARVHTAIPANEKKAHEIFDQGDPPGGVVLNAAQLRLDRRKKNLDAVISYLSAKWGQT